MLWGAVPVGVLGLEGEGLGDGYLWMGWRERFLVRCCGGERGHVVHGGRWGGRLGWALTFTLVWVVKYSF